MHTFFFALLLQVSSSVLSSSGEGTGSGSAVKYPGQDGLYTSVGLSQPSDVASVRGEPWCPMALAWNTESLGGQQSLAPLCGCYVEVLEGQCLFPSSQLMQEESDRVERRVRRPLSPTASLNQEWNSRDWFPDWCGDLVALWKQRESPGHMINQVACCGWFLDLPCTRYRSHPMAQTQILYLKNKAIVYITDFLSESCWLDTTAS